MRLHAFVYPAQGYDVARMKADDMLRAGFLLAAVTTTLLVVAQLINGLVLDDRYFDLNARAEGNAFTWASVCAAFAAALGASLLGAHLLSAILAFLSLDDLALIHERVGDKVARDGLGLSEELADQFEVVAFFPLFALALLLSWTLAVRVGAVDGERMRLGLVTLGVAVVVEVLGVATRPLEEDGTQWPNRVRVALEEGLELAGWILLASGLLAAVLRRADAAER